MHYFSFLHLFSAQIYIILAIVILIRDPASRLNRLCSAIFLCFFIWSFSWTFIQDPRVSKNTAILFENIGAVGWFLFSPLFVWFAMLYAKKKVNGFLLALLFSYPVVCIFRQFFGPGLFADHTLHAYGWFGVWRHSLWVYLFFSYYFVNMCLSAFLIYGFSRKADNPLITRQSTLLIISFLVPLVFGTISNTVLPLLGISSVPPVADVFILSWAIGMTYAVWRYRLLSITTFVAAEQIVAAMKDLLLLLDTHGRILSVNQATLDALEYRRDELEGKPFEMIFGEPARELDAPPVPETFRSSTLTEFEISLVSKSGAAIPVSLSTSILPERGIVCVAHDISFQKLRTELLMEQKERLEDEVSNALSEQKKTTAQLLQEVTRRMRAVRALEESELRFKTVFEFAPDGFYLMDDTGRFVDCNREAQRITGYAREALIGSDPFSLALVPAFPVDSDPTPFARGTLDRATGPDELTITRKDGARIPLEISTYPLAINERRLTLGIVRDISLRKKNEEEKKALLEELNQKQKLEAIGSLAGGIAHDFNNLIGGIIGYADLLRRKLGTSLPAETPLAEKIIAVARQASELTARLLAFARKGKYQEEVIDIHEAALDVIAILERTIDKRIVITTDFKAAPPTIMGNRSQIQNALLNLAVNSRDAMPEGGILTFKTESVAIGEDFLLAHRYNLTKGAYLRFSVIDTGIGMDEETRARAFDPFFTTKEQGKGTGLGLASVYGTIQNHNGFIDLQSEKDRGTSVIMCLPVTLAPVRKAPDPTVPPAQNTGAGTIMIVDDEPSIREMACEALQMFGYTAIGFGKARKAIDHYRKHHAAIDLLLIDLSMPEMSGDDCFRAMKAINPGIKAIISSGHTSDAMINKLLAEGVISFLPKPFDLDRLAATIRKAL